MEYFLSGGIRTKSASTLKNVGRIIDNMKKEIKCKLKEDKQDEFIEKYDFESYKYAGVEDKYYLKLTRYLILDQDTLEILSPTNKLTQEEIDLLYKLDQDKMLEYYDIGE